MLWVNVRRIFRSGIVSFLRNSFVSLAAIFVMTMTLTIIGSLMFLNITVSQFIAYVEDKVDVNVYFTPEASAEAIDGVTQGVKSLPEVAYVEFMSQEDVLSEFRTRHENDQLTIQALDELAANPFGAKLSIKAKEPSQYAGIAEYLKEREVDEAGVPFIDSVNYERNKVVIDQLETLTTYVERFGYAVIILFALASILITFNTLRLAIYTAREEISVMRLVGASNMYIRGPFIVEGTLYGLASGIIALVLFFPITYFLRGATTAAFGTDLFVLYLAHLPLFLATLIVAGALLGATSSFLAVRKYLSV